ncbi:MAG: 3-hydroxybutyryl-CoA dehydrogenase [Bacteroidetes bacterium 24-39-8]|jgi:3-hydroxybutyryl-CoA dehydrogenase|nr:MAG: 3-hydroxybutyryl-CoA dehydrogenase [Sphingobacteriia bacterium 35-40-8]OYZ53228.1 MAG: 3-hydroxybutyryl-CoA dehydrogenase [Bacteroidetes bacterium 24-39-8]OZA68433.1 MAG: 3-hydroxybutyryl-CoA dehydrogenase [Sphingobacteriia bacterium 39-39-8]HQR92421.1 3-hydroxyacyl-CoA dehydrogenase NAD-binding domain-containing protein [Sediminibacterium sp.]HQS53501.1 3-hydroxyacyl-CoA dehydrogenase NAD-binding domain-containing protein [Sediminibacterium sp.]
MHQVKTICICGAGTMGSGIAMVAAQAGFQSILFDLNDVVLEKAQSNIWASWNALLAKGKINQEDLERFQSQIRFTDKLQDCQADLIIEAIIEKLVAKTDLFRSLEELNPINTILASNTSSISINQIAQHLEHPSRFVGMHFFNPAPVMKLVELVQGDDTNEKVMTLLQAICQKMGKTAVVCKDAPGFIVNRVARHYYLESMWMMASAEENGEELDPASIDKILTATGFKMGPFQLMDLIGMDINYGVSQIVYDALGKPERLKPSPIQAQKVANGQLGKKSGKGFYDY